MALSSSTVIAQSKSYETRMAKKRLYQLMKYILLVCFVGKCISGGQEPRVIT